MAEDVYTTSIIVQAQPEVFNEVEMALLAMDFTQIAHAEKSAGKFIVLLETQSMQQIENWIHNARLTQGVLCVTMVYQHVDTIHSLNEVIA